jgi:predicted nucleic acid-binding protein
VSDAPLVLDAAGLSGLIDTRPPDKLRALLAEAHRLGREVLCPTVVCAEMARGRGRTRALEVAVSRHDRPSGERPAIRLIDTDFPLARHVGALLHATGRGSERIVDAHAVAICLPHGGGLVVTGDPDDINELAAALPAVRIRTVTL